ncbi:hypothetical protein L226DRAFT_617849 [Lentinus tigrinus ALCF2SS1-7]|uniref:N-acetyltransferase domain-containing protein n=1 Tax=Lentinus tigrinus ALCF2SS1-6 TaxID=1328759 RepID=A0A5C2RUQ6_9APHY|nr:hypothetical protein L227DRAFT_657586 [Lentinus tigrinus ALCF2SS1-6]RPD67832.1 hypothetical protein L226DRAFT_617849 [Lentinus tigrinus ALCF2SS1-7]
MTTASSRESLPLLAGEKAAACLQEHDVQVKPLKYRDIPKAVEGVMKAFANDSMMNYFKDAEPLVFQARQRLDVATRFADCVHRHKIYTVNRGDSFLYYGVPGDNEYRPPFTWILFLTVKAGGREMRKRKHEFITKAMALIKTAIGDKVEDCFEVQGLGTVPEKQGHGYATALISIVHEMADAQGRATYVITGDAWKYYESVGYKLIGEDWFGADNPNWHGPPGPIRLMLREPQPILKR